MAEAAGFVLFSKLKVRYVVGREGDSGRGGLQLQVERRWLWT